MTTPDAKKLVISTTNKGKLREIHAIMAGLHLNLLGLDQFADVPEVIEDADTLEGNATKKAETLLEFTSIPTMADDTGLEVISLGGAPGVHSARFAGENADDAANRALLLKKLESVDDRRAQFRTVIALALDSGTFLFEGACQGKITREERGEGGFGYDRIFQPDGSDQTFAELDAAEKNKISHRARALERFVSYMTALLQNGGHAE